MRDTKVIKWVGKLLHNYDILEAKAGADLKPGSNLSLR
jgi:hypothetical protein